MSVIQYFKRSIPRLSTLIHKCAEFTVGKLSEISTHEYYNKKIVYFAIVIIGKMVFCHDSMRIWYKLCYSHPQQRIIFLLVWITYNTACFFHLFHSYRNVYVIVSENIL